MLPSHSCFKFLVLTDGQRSPGKNLDTVGISFDERLAHLEEQNLELVSILVSCFSVQIMLHLYKKLYRSWGIVEQLFLFTGSQLWWCAGLSLVFLSLRRQNYTKVENAIGTVRREISLLSFNTDGKNTLSQV